MADQRHPNVISELQDKPLSEIVLESRRRRNNASVLTWNVKTDRNVGVICRTAEIMGIEHFFTLGFPRIDTRSAVGSQNYLTLIKKDCLTISDQEESFQQILDEYNFIPIFVEQGGTSLNQVDWNQFSNDRLLFIFGSEADGIPLTILERAKAYHARSMIVSIEQQGVGRSLNVGAASAIVLYHFNNFK